MADLVVTNIRIPKEDYALYKAIAAEKGESFAELAREALAEKVKPKAMRKKKRRSLWDIGKYAIKAGEPQASQTIDEVVYGYPHDRGS